MQMAKILSNSKEKEKAQLFRSSRIRFVVGQHSIIGLRHYCIQNVKDGIQIRVY